MLVLFVGWGTFFVYVLWRFRAKRHPVADPHGRHQPHLDLARGRGGRGRGDPADRLLDPALGRPRRALPRARRRDRRCAWSAEQFAWNIHYPGPDGVFGRTDVKLVDAQSNPLGLDRGDPAAKDDVTTINQLHLPVGRPAIVQLSSKDVIH